MSWRFKLSLISLVTLVWIGADILMHIVPATIQIVDVVMESFFTLLLIGLAGLYMFRPRRQVS